MVVKIPKGLSRDARRIWLKATRSYHFLPTDPELLEVGLRNWDLAAESRAILKKEGMYFRDKQGNLKLHPQAVILKNCENTFCKCWRLLNFKEGPQKTGRPSQSRIFEEEE